MKKILLFFLISSLGFGQTLDTSFDGDGIKTQNISNTSSNQAFYDGLIQTDGKILIGGRMLQPNTNSLLVRYNADGSKDNTFNQYGFRVLNSQGIQSIFQQTDGKILAASRNIIHRFNTDGSFDNSFNTTGSLSISISGLTVNIKKISTQTDGKIIASGFIMTTSTNSDLIVIRLNSDGSLDTSFNSTGFSIIPIGSTHNNAFSHKIQSDGKIVLVGDYLISGTNYDFTIIRLDSNGIQDSTFGGSGIVTTDFGISTRDQARDLEILPSGKIFVIGASAGKLACAMYNSDGSLDLSYNSSGKYTTPINISYSLTSTGGTSLHSFPKITKEVTGKYLISLTSDTDYKVIRLLTDAFTFDTSFNGSGIVSQNNNTNDVANFVALKSNGKIITGGFSNNSATPLATVTNSTIAKLIEINSNGSIYGNNTKEIYLGLDSSHYTTISPVDQSIFTTTSSLLTNGSNLVITKFNPDGSLNTSFGTNGRAKIVSSDFPTDKIAILNDNSILICGSNFNSIYKLTPSGILDTNFGTNGVLDVYNLTGGIVTFIDNFSISPDNKIVLGIDYTSPQAYISNGVLKLNLNGTIDTTFGTNGYVNYRFNPDEVNYYEFPYSMIVENDGKITIASVSYLFTAGLIENTKNYMARLNSDGTFDTTFGTNGKISNNISLSQIPANLIKTNNNEYLLNLKVITNGGNTFNTSKTLKLNYDGSINNSFGNNGFSDDILNNFNTEMVLQPDGKFLKTGYNIINNQISTSRYLPNGNIDTTFGISGEKNEPIGIFSNSSDINYLNDGKILVTADSFDGEYQALTLIKYTNLNLGNISFEKENHNLLIYPNPIQDLATFEFEINNPETLTIDIVDMKGQIVKNIFANKYYPSGFQKIEINLDGLTTGNYILRLCNSENKKQVINILKK